MKTYPGHQDFEDYTRQEYPLSPLGYGLVGALAGVVIISLIGAVSYGIGSAVDAVASFLT
ncbi:MAG: hypothetical protein KBC38_03635 [Candidatus Pacebacteria bacterium]|nr:hypothetical protein [Candidatus Paceibacterota bacterium]MBP9840148.1 hypothetical protein [Candidatus Paceibacterota bacterium]